MSADLTTAEELLLAVWDDDRGKSRYASNLSQSLAGALLIELAIIEAITVEEKRVVVAHGPESGEPLLDRARQRIRADAKRRKVSDWMKRLARRDDARDQVLERLVERGVLRADHRRILRVFPATRHPTVHRDLARGVRERLAGDLLHDGDLPPRRAALGGLVAPFASGLSRRLYGDWGDRRAASRRAKQLSKGEGISGDVGKAIRDAQAAATAAVAAGAAASASSGSGGS